MNMNFSSRVNYVIGQLQARQMGFKLAALQIDISGRTSSCKISWSYLFASLPDPHLSLSFSHSLCLLASSSLCSVSEGRECPPSAAPQACTIIPDLLLRHTVGEEGWKRGRGWREPEKEWVRQRDIKVEMDMCSWRKGEAPRDEAVAMPKTRRTKHTCTHTHTYTHAHKVNKEEAWLRLAGAGVSERCYRGWPQHTNSSDSTHKEEAHEHSWLREMGEGDSGWRKMFSTSDRLPSVFSPLRLHHLA